MTSKTLIAALAMLLTATSASWAWTQGHMKRHHHGLYNSVMMRHHHSMMRQHRHGLYNSAGMYHQKGGPGPRVQAGSGQGAGAESGTKP
jgi:hypothetical protein